MTEAEYQLMVCCHHRVNNREWHNATCVIYDPPPNLVGAARLLEKKGWARMITSTPMVTAPFFVLTMTDRGRLAQKMYDAARKLSGIYPYTWNSNDT